VRFNRFPFTRHKEGATCEVEEDDEEYKILETTATEKHHQMIDVRPTIMTTTISFNNYPRYNRTGFLVFLYTVYFLASKPCRISVFLTPGRVPVNARAG